MIRAICMAMVSALLSAPLLAQQSEEKPPKSGWWKKLTEEPEMVLPESLQRDVRVFPRTPLRNFRPLSDPVEFPPYRVDRPKPLTFEEVWIQFDRRVDAATEPRSIGFTVYENEIERWRVACLWTPIGRPRLGGVPLPGAEIRISHRCKIRPIGRDEAWILEVDTASAEEAARGESPTPGRLTDGKVTYAVTPSYSGESLLGLVGLTGYLFAVDGDPIAAAATSLRGGRLIFRNSVSESERSLLTAAAYGLLLIPELSKWP